MRDICICQNNRDLLIHCNTAGISWATKPSKYPSEEEHPKDIVKESTYTDVCAMRIRYFWISNNFFFSSRLNGNYSHSSFKPAKNILHEKLKRIHKFKRETYHLLLMTSVKTEILYFSPLIIISPSNLPIHDEKKK